MTCCAVWDGWNNTHLLRGAYRFLITRRCTNTYGAVTLTGHVKTKAQKFDYIYKRRRPVRITVQIRVGSKKFVLIYNGDTLVNRHRSKRL